MAEDYGVQRIVSGLSQTLRDYLEAQYHIRDESLISERHKLLNAQGTISQAPYVESTPIYKTERSYASLNIPDAVRDFLTNLSKLENPDVGIYNPPYSHQAEALEAFLGDGDDLIVATGTGSGKTESFLMPILGNLILEQSERPDSAQLPGCRALLLYPLNALVSDQLSRIRRLFGDDRIASLIEAGRGRRVRFGMYTSRTPYPGLRISKRDQFHIAPLFNDFYLPYADDKETRRELEQKGKWPSKDLVSFFGKSGERWEQRLKTKYSDTELLTRHEMHSHCPDLLITNYSMLEYMLLRPIERNIFDQTRTWLKSDERNQFILVLDEAHTYRGTGGAEVALLIRRLQARLEIPRERFRCILTSASLGRGETAEDAVIEFARDLTGLSDISSHGISLIQGTREKRKVKQEASTDTPDILAAFRLGDFQQFHINQEIAVKAVKDLGKAFNWPNVENASEDLAQFLFDSLSGWEPVENLIEEISGNATEFSKLAACLFPKCETSTRVRATEVLIALSTFARRKEDGRVLVPTRLHLFFRGLPAIYACINPKCTERLDEDREQYLLGRLYTEPLTQCKCGGRVYELLTHRDCGAAFLRGYIRGQQGDFLWHESSGEIGREQVVPLSEVHFMVEGEPHPKVRAESAECWIDWGTGMIRREKPNDLDRFLRAFIATTPPETSGSRQVFSFEQCPICTRRWQRGRSKIMDLATKGEAPFANLVKAQVVTQPAKEQISAKSPNGGRQSLLFSDGRQKAARLARDIPREVELDSFRQAIALAAQELDQVGREPRLTKALYISFVSIVTKFFLQFFDREDQKDLQKHAKDFNEFYDNDLLDALDDWTPDHIPTAYRKALLRQLCSSFYSISSATIGFVVPSRSALRQLNRRLEMEFPQLKDHSEALACSWIASLLDELAFDRTIHDNIREAVAGYYNQTWGSRGRFQDKARQALQQILQDEAMIDQSDLNQLNDIFQSVLCSEQEGLFFINPDRVCLRVSLEHLWFQCQSCTYLSPVTLLNRCPNCGSNNVEALNPASSEYLRARKGFWRGPIANTLSGTGRPVHITAEEHTAQLSQRDAGVVYATTEKYELRFQGVLIGDDDGPVDVLSCTTTMEVGVDIGSLVAIGLRNVPPQRENYQQRAGRAGRRGSAVSTVITYGQGGPHDSHYFFNPAEIVSGDPRQPMIKIDNEKIARRHMHSYLIQTFFHEALDRGGIPLATSSGYLQSALGRAHDFYNEDPSNDMRFGKFSEWVHRRVIDQNGDLLESIISWLPKEISTDLPDWLKETSHTLLSSLIAIGKEIEDKNKGEDDEEGEGLLLDVLFGKGILPTYAFPTDLSSFSVEKLEKNRGRWRVVTEERPQQAIGLALSEYAPGRLIVIDKKTYRSGGIAASTIATERDRARPLFDHLTPYIYCPSCGYVQDPQSPEEEGGPCPVCRTTNLDKMDMVTPEVFHPENSKELEESDREQELTYATSAQFPVPIGGREVGEWQRLGRHSSHTYENDRLLVIVNKGKKDENLGFQVCEKCGTSVVTGQGSLDRHERCYRTQWGQGGKPPACDGQPRQVFLGHTFQSDVMIWRIGIEDPLSADMSSSIAINALSDSLRTLADGLLISASRFLDVDPAEFSVGFRIVPSPEPGKQMADVYLFDTLSGGAGYADQVGRDISDILRNHLLLLLQNCPKLCDRSCYNCLRHYGNQHWHESLDRHLAVTLLNYALDGTLPLTDDLHLQAERLRPLRHMLELEGYKCVQGRSYHGYDIPLWIKTSNGDLAVGCFNGLLDDLSEGFSHPLHEVETLGGPMIQLLNDYQLSRNLPDAYQLVRELIG